MSLKKRTSRRFFKISIGLGNTSKALINGYSLIVLIVLFFNLVGTYTSRVITKISDMLIFCLERLTL